MKQYRYGEIEHHAVCTNCEKQDCTVTHYSDDILCDECDEKRDNKTGYCSMNCQLGGGCDGSC